MSLLFVLNVLHAVAIAVALFLPLAAMLFLSKGLLDRGWSAYPKFFVTGVTTLMLAIYVAVTAPYSEMSAQSANLLTCLSIALIVVGVVVGIVCTVITAEQKDPIGFDGRD